MFYNLFSKNISEDFVCMCLESIWKYAFMWRQDLFFFNTRFENILVLSLQAVTIIYTAAKKILRLCMLWIEGS